MLLKNTEPENSRKLPNEIRCLYWNRGFCKKGDKCGFYHAKEDCEEYSRTGKCEDRGCQSRHRKQCRYFSTQEGCYRRESCQIDNCQYQHGTRRTQYQDRKILQQDKLMFKCDLCDFQCDRKVTLMKHFNTKHAQSSSYEKELVDNENVPQFITRLGLENFPENIRNTSKKTALRKEKIL